VAAAEGQVIIHQLVAGADVFMTNLATTEALQQYRLDYETMPLLTT
jgi:crotonobetainyl-CoA:carnitine CoA-transferase CaiB-like acyl-CoA transferase